MEVKIRWVKVKASQCIPCSAWWAPWIYGPEVGEPCSHCGRPTVEFGDGETQVELETVSSADGWLWGWRKGAEPMMIPQVPVLRVTRGQKIRTLAVFRPGDQRAILAQVHPDGGGLVLLVLQEVRR